VKEALVIHFQVSNCHFLCSFLHHSMLTAVPVPQSSVHSESSIAYKKFIRHY